MKRARLTVTTESTKTGKNTGFVDNVTKEHLGLRETIKRVENGMYKDYVTKKGENGKYISSKPDKNYPNLG